MGATPYVPPIIPGNRGPNPERSGSSAEILSFRTGSTAEPEDTEASSSTAGEPDDAIVGEVFDYKVHGGKAFRPRIGPKDREKGHSSRLFRPGSAEHATLLAMKRYGKRGRDALKGAAKQTARVKRK